MRIFVNALVVSLLAVLATSPAAAQATVDPTGHWEGTITAPMGQIDFEIDVVRDATSALSATYGQRASSVRGLPLTQVALDGRSFTFVLSTGGAGGGAFKGDILSDGKTISGDVKATVGSAPFTAYRTGEAVVAWKITNAIVSAALAGRWTGTLDAGGGQAVLQLTIANRENGTAFARSRRPANRNSGLKRHSPSAAATCQSTFRRWEVHGRVRFPATRWRERGRRRAARCR